MAFQWLGDINQANNQSASQIGGGLGNMLSGYVGEKQRQDTLQRQEVELKSKMDNLSFEKKMDAARLVTTLLSHVDDDKRTEILNDPDVQAIYQAAGVPLPSSSPASSPEEDGGGLFRGVGKMMGGVGESWRKLNAPENATQTEVGAMNPLRLTPWFSHSSQSSTRPQSGQPSFSQPKSQYREEDIQYTMKKYKMTREEVLRKLEGK